MRHEGNGSLIECPYHQSTILVNSVTPRINHTSILLSRIFNGNVSPTPVAETRRYLQHDHDFLIETEHNMNEYNSDFNRLAGVNELTLNNETNGALVREARNADNVELALPDSAIDDVYDATPVRLVSGGSMGMGATPSPSQSQSVRGRGRSASRVRGPLFYSHNSANAVTLAGDRGRRSNDPCAQQ